MTLSLISDLGLSLQNVMVLVLAQAGWDCGRMPSLLALESPSGKYVTRVERVLDAITTCKKKEKRCLNLDVPAFLMYHFDIF